MEAGWLLAARILRVSASLTSWSSDCQSQGVLDSFTVPVIVEWRRWKVEKDGQTLLEVRPPPLPNSETGGTRALLSLQGPM